MKVVKGLKFPAGEKEKEGSDDEPVDDGLVGGRPNDRD